MPVAGGKIECLTADNKAADGCPRFSPDGKLLAYRTQKRPGYEADRWVPMLVEVDAAGSWRGKPRAVLQRGGQTELDERELSGTVRVCTHRDATPRL